MATFKDREGNTWNVRVDLPVSRELARVTPYDICNPNHYQSLMESIGARLELVWYLVKAQGEDNGVENLRDFEKVLGDDDDGGGYVFDASDALCEACIAFFRRLGLTPMVTIAETYLEMGRKLLEQTRTEAFQEELAHDREKFAETLGLDSGGTDGSTPPPSRLKPAERRKKSKKGKTKRGRRGGR